MIPRHFTRRGVLFIMYMARGLAGPYSRTCRCMQRARSSLFHFLFLLRRLARDASPTIAYIVGGLHADATRYS